MFGKKKRNNAIINTVDDSRAVVYDFVRRFPYESYRPVEYRPFPDLQKELMLPKLDQYLQALLAGDVDDGNGDMLDSIIFDPFRIAVPDLEKQGCEHRDIIRRLNARRISDRADFSRIRDKESKELAGLEKEFEQTCRKIERLEEG